MSMLKRKILSLVGNAFVLKARVAEVNPVSEHFRFIDLECEEFRDMTWGPGEKVQINVGDWNMRTYTPLSFDPENGRLGVLAYVHGNGPGSLWASSVKAGDPCLLIGPQPSLKLSNEELSFVFFGDETTIGAATTLKRNLILGKRMRMVFESERPDELKRIAQDLGLGEVAVFKRDAEIPSDEALQFLLDSAKSLGSCEVILTGRAQSIKSARTRLKSNGFPMSQIRTKAYWSEGKTGLD